MYRETARSFDQVKVTKSLLEELFSYLIYNSGINSYIFCLTAIPEQRLVGADVATYGQFPWMVITLSFFVKYIRFLLDSSEFIEPFNQTHMIMQAFVLITDIYSRCRFFFS